MPAYEVDVQGVTYDVDAPDPDTAWVWANQFHAEQGTAETKPKEESSALKDYGSALAAGAGKILPSAVKGVAQIGDLITGGRFDLGVQQAMTDTMTSVEDYWRTENLTKKSREFERLMQDDEFGVGDMLSYLLDNPELLVEKTVETTGSMLLPLGAAGAVGKAGKMLDLAQPTIAKALTATTVGTTMAQNAADTFASPELQDMPLEDRYKAAGVSAVASLLAGVITKGGAEGTIAKKLLSEVEEGKVNVGKIKNFLQSVGTTFVKEGFQEGVEESGNVLGTVVGGAEVTPEGAAKQIALSTTIGGLMGAGVGAVARPEVEQPEAPPTEFSPESLGIDPEMAARIAAAERARVMAPAPAEEAVLTPPTPTAPTPSIAAPTAPARLTLPELDAARVAEIEQELIASGRPPNEAKYYAAVRARREKAFASQAQAPAQVAGEPVGGGVGVSPTVPMPTTEPPTTGAIEEPERLGMVRAGEAVGEISGTAGPEPTALEPITEVPTIEPVDPYVDVAQKVRAGEIKPTVPAVKAALGVKTPAEARSALARMESDGIVQSKGGNKGYVLAPAPAPVEAAPVEAAPAEIPTWDTIQPGQLVTLYRGEDARNEANGQWWTTDRAKAEQYGNVTEVTLPAEVIGKHAAQGAGSNDVFVFPTVANRPPQLAKKYAPKVAPAEQVSQMVSLPAPESMSAVGQFNPKEVEKISTPKYKSRERLVEMPIDDFLNLADELKAKTAGTADRLLKEGKQYESLPFLNIEDDGQVSGHEGRHRALALKNAGYKTMPVVLRSSNIRWDQQNNPNNFDYIADWPTELKAQRKAKDPSFKTPFPVSRENAAAPYEGVKRPAQDTINVDGVDRPTLNSEGRPIHPTEKGIRNFWRWFGDSKVVDEQGRPLVVYHGTPADFKAFKEGTSWEGFGFHFGTAEAANQVLQQDRHGGGKPQIMPVYLSIKNQLKFDASYDRGRHDPMNIYQMVMRKAEEDGVPGITEDDIDAYYQDEHSFNGTNFLDVEGVELRNLLRKWLGSMGYDGIEYVNAGEDAGSTSWIAFTPTQVKSAIGNRGTFDVTKGDIGEQIDIPARADKNNPDLFSDLKDFDTALDAIVERATNPAQRLIAQRIRQRAKDLKKLGFKFSLRVTGEGRVLKSGARGTSTLVLSGLGEATSVDIVLNHPSNGDQSGTNWKTVTHELAHAVTQAQIRLNPEGSAARQLRRLFNDLVDHFNAKVEAGKVDGKLKEGALTPFEERIYNRQINALGSPDEILAWGLTDTGMQQWLNSIPSKQGTFLSRLFNVVASALGFTRTNTALAELLTVSDTLLAGPLSPYMKAAESKRLSFGLQENKTGIPSWALMYAEGQKVVWHDKDAALISAKSVFGAPIHLLATPKGISRVDVGSYTGDMLPRARLEEVKNIAANLTTVSEQKDVTPPTKRKKISSLAKDLQKEAAKAQKEADELQKAVEYARKVYKQSRNAEEIAENNKLAMKLRKKGGWKDVIGTIADSTQNVGLEVLVRQAPTEFLIDLALRHPELQELARTKRLVETMDGRRAQMLEGGAALIDDLRALTKDKLEAFSEAILTSTIAQVDGRTDARETEITRLYRQLGPKGQEAYGKYFDYYDTMMGYLQQILVTNVEGLASTPAERDVFLKRINEMFAKENRIQPYAPLARDQGGEFFLGIGEGTNREFYIRRSAADRDALAKELAAQRGTTVEAMKTSGELTMGNELSKLRSEMAAEGTLLRDIYEMIDQSGTKDEALKEAIFQMWVHLQPEQSMLKNFAKRKKYPPAGFTTDVLKNLNDSIIKFSNQLPRLQYMSQIRQSITQARAAIEDTPELTPYVAEIDRRVEDLLNPTAEGTWGQIVTLANSSTFSYYMSMSTGVLQILGTYQTGVPQLLKNHSFVDVNKELGNLLPVFSSTGTHDKRGKWKMPTITEAAALEANKNDKPDVALRKAEDRKLVQLMRDRNVVEATAARDIFNFSEVPTELVDSKLQRAKVTYDTLVGGLIHHTERLSREAIYLASARLWKKKFAEEFRKTPEYAEATNKQAAEHAHVMSRINEIADKAAYDVQTSLFNYSKFGKPRYMNAPTGRLITQFMTYQLNALVFMGRNLLGMVYPLGSDTRAGCIKAFTAAMLNTWVTSGALGLFGGKLLLGMLAAFSDGWEDEKPAEMKDLEPTLWFKNKWLPETLGEVDVFGESANKAIAKIVADGPINYMTGLDAASRTSLIELATPPDVELRATESIKGTVAEYALALAGPSVSMIIARAEGMQDIANGDIYKGAEKIMPALLRNPMQAFRYSMDGETTKDGETVVAPSGFTVGNLVGKSIGFSPVTVADVKNATRKAMIVEQKIIGEKTSILNELERAFRKGDGVAYGKALDKMNAYNYKYSMTYPEYVITGEMIRDRIERRGKERAESSRGYRLKQENVFMATEMLGPSRRAAEEAEKEGK